MLLRLAGQSDKSNDQEAENMSYFTFHSKKIFYKEAGHGKPLVMLHGDTASSVMFEFLLPLYQEHFRVILLDFLGNGQSDRVSLFPADLWLSQAEQVIALIEHMHIGKVNILGTSGGAWIAVNTALKRPDLTEKVIADSFDGRTLHETFAEDLLKERRAAMQDPSARQFYQWCQGEDWESREDTMCRRNMEEEYLEMSRLVQDGSIHMFQTGGHPSILTNAELSARVITEFIYR